MEFKIRNYSPILLIFLLIGMGCRSHRMGNIGLEVKPTPEIQRSQIARIEITLPSDTNHLVYAGIRNPKSVFYFYQQQGFKPFWQTVNPSFIADSLISFIKTVRYYGLRPQEYHLAEIMDMIDSRDSLCRLDVLLSDAFFTLTNQVSNGRINQKKKWLTDSIQYALINQLNQGKNLHEVIHELEPAWIEYHSLKSALRILIDTIPRAEKKLLLEGHIPDTASYKRKLQQVEINLERWRGEIEAPGNDYIMINIPAFRLYYMRADTVFFSSRVIVGTIDRQTPVLSSKLECFTLYPFWYVPRKIAVEEYLPVLQRDSLFLQRNNFDVLNRDGVVLDPAAIPWKNYSVSYFPVSLRQREGSVNALGLVKFVFDNPYQVYLHDTNARRLFNNRNRALSHGCVRVENAITLAHLLITGVPKKISTEVDYYILRKERHNVNLKESIPIHIRYLTAEYREGIFYFYDDVYLQDRQLIKTFYQP